VASGHSGAGHSPLAPLEDAMRRISAAFLEAARADAVSKSSPANDFRQGREPGLPVLCGPTAPHSTWRGQTVARWAQQEGAYRGRSGVLCAGNWPPLPDGPGWLPGANHFACRDLRLGRRLRVGMLCGEFRPHNTPTPRRRGLWENYAARLRCISGAILYYAARSGRIISTTSGHQTGNLSCSAPLTHFSHSFFC